MHGVKYEIYIYSSQVLEQSEPGNTLGFGVIKIILVDKTETYMLKMT